MNKEGDRLEKVSGIAKEIHDLGKENEIVQQAINEKKASLQKMSEDDMQQNQSVKEKVSQITLRIQKLNLKKEKLESSEKKLNAEIQAVKQHVNDFRCKIKDLILINGDLENYCSTVVEDIRTDSREEFLVQVDNFNNSIQAYINMQDENENDY